MIVLKNILVPTDFGAAAHAALRYGRTLAETFGADLHVLHVLDNDFLEPRFADPAAIEAAASEELTELAASDAQRRFQTHAILKKFESPSDAITRYARVAAIDLIVIGTHGRDGVAHWLTGSVAQHIVRTACCPVLVVRHPEREFITATDMPESVPA